jgi:hypothetical protein
MTPRDQMAAAIRDLVKRIDRIPDADLTPAWAGCADALLTALRRLARGHD